jgi:hypothetical protein
LRDRLDDRFAIDLLYDPVTRAVSRPGETADDFAARLQNAPALVTKRRSLEAKLEDKRGALAAKQQELQGRSMEKWASLGNSILSNFGLLSGRKRRVTGVSGTLSKQRMEANARSAIERLEADVAQLETELAEAGFIDTSRFEQRTVRPTKSDLTLIRYDIVWVY